MLFNINLLYDSAQTKSSFTLPEFALNTVTNSYESDV
jgi:hypothetical protein